MLFDRNVAGVALTTPDGRIVDCNEACSRIFGFHSRAEMLAHTAWEVYFDKAERKALVERLRAQLDCPAGEVCMRSEHGERIWVLTTRTVADFRQSAPKTLQTTVLAT